MKEHASSISLRVLWVFLRRTRHKVAELMRAHPLHAPVLGPVHEAIAVAEISMIDRDPALPERRGRGPRGSPRITGDEQLRARITELEAALRERDAHLAAVVRRLREPLSPIRLLVAGLVEQGRAIPDDGMRTRLDDLAIRIDRLVDLLPSE